METLIKRLEKLGYTKAEAEKVIASYEEQCDLDALKDYLYLREMMKYERD